MGYNNNRTGGKKRSGARFHNTSKNGKPCVNGWIAYKDKSYKFKFIASPGSNVKSGRVKSGEVWESWACKISPLEGFGVERMTTMFFFPESKSFSIPDVQLKGNCGKNVSYPANWKKRADRAEQKSQNRRYNGGGYQRRKYQGNSYNNGGGYGGGYGGGGGGYRNQGGWN